MGHRVNPKSFRLSLNRTWVFQWVSYHNNNYKYLVLNDFFILKIMKIIFFSLEPNILKSDKKNKVRILKKISLRKIKKNFFFYNFRVLRYSNKINKILIHYKHKYNNYKILGKYDKKEKFFLDSLKQNKKFNFLSFIPRSEIVKKKRFKKKKKVDNEFKYIKSKLTFFLKDYNYKKAVKNNNNLNIKYKVFICFFKLRIFFLFLFKVLRKDILLEKIKKKVKLKYLKNKWIKINKIYKLYCNNFSFFYFFLKYIIISLNYIQKFKYNLSFFFFKTICILSQIFKNFNNNNFFFYFFRQEANFLYSADKIVFKKKSLFKYRSKKLLYLENKINKKLVLKNTKKNLDLFQKIVKRFIKNFIKKRLLNKFFFYKIFYKSFFKYKKENFIYLINFFFLLHKKFIKIFFFKDFFLFLFFKKIIKKYTKGLVKFFNNFGLFFNNFWLIKFFINKLNSNAIEISKRRVKKFITKRCRFKYIKINKLFKKNNKNNFYISFNFNLFSFFSNKIIKKYKIKNLLFFFISYFLKKKIKKINCFNTYNNFIRKKKKQIFNKKKFIKFLIKKSKFQKKKIIKIRVFKNRLLYINKNIIKLFLNFFMLNNINATFIAYFVRYKCTYFPDVIGILAPSIYYLKISKRKFLGYKVVLNGRFSRRTRKRKMLYYRGKMPHNTLKCPIDYDETSFMSRFGKTGVKIWFLNTFSLKKLLIKRKLLNILYNNNIYENF